MNQYYCFFKNKHVFKETCTIVCSEITFSKNLYHLEISQLIALLDLFQYNILLKSVSEFILVAVTLINCRIIMSYMT